MAAILFRGAEPFVQFWWDIISGIIFNLAQCFRCHLKLFLSFALVAILFSQVELFVHYGRRHYEEHFCEIILNFDKWLRRCCLKTYYHYDITVIRWITSCHK